MKEDMSTICLCIDHREQALIARIPADSQPYPVVVENLHLGDLQLRIDDQLAYIFERKTLADLAASIKDGRYREQSARLCASGLPPWRVTYIIEGIRSLEDIPEGGMVHGIAGRALCSALLGIQYREGFGVYFSGSTMGTVSYIRMICARVAKDPMKWGRSISEGDSYIDCLKTKVEKRENITPEVCFQLQLCQIPGVSTKLAKAIAERYHSMAEMVLELHTAGREDAERGLREVPLLGPKKAAVIYRYLCNETSN